MNLLQQLKASCSVIASLFHLPGEYRVRYLIESITETETGQYQVQVKALAVEEADFSASPEAILADDDLTNGFSPRDIRALTYLGYLEVNSPKYQILASKLSEKDGLLFALKSKKDNDTVIKSARELSSDPELLNELNQQDAHKVGFSTANQTIDHEQAIKQRLIEQAKREAQ